MQPWAKGCLMKTALVASLAALVCGCNSVSPGYDYSDAGWSYSVDPNWVLSSHVAGASTHSIDGSCALRNPAGDAHPVG